MHQLCDWQAIVIFALVGVQGVAVYSVPVIGKAYFDSCQRAHRFLKPGGHEDLHTAEVDNYAMHPDTPMQSIF